MYIKHAYPVQSMNTKSKKSAAHSTNIYLFLISFYFENWLKLGTVYEYDIPKALPVEFTVLPWLLCKYLGVLRARDRDPSTETATNHCIIEKPVIKIS